MSRDGTGLCSTSLSDNGKEKDTPPQQSTFSVQETQENYTTNVVASSMQFRLPNSSEDLRNLILGKRQAEAENAMLQTHSQQLTKDKETLEKQLEKRESEIDELKTTHQKIEKESKEHIRSLEEQISKDKEELESLKVRIAELKENLSMNKKWEKMKSLKKLLQSMNKHLKINTNKTFRIQEKNCGKKKQRHIKRKLA